MVRLTAKGEVAHPAKFSPDILAHIHREMKLRMAQNDWVHATVLDPFAGVGTIHDLQDPFLHTHAIELEPEWAEVSAAKGATVCMDMRRFQCSSPFNFIATSITYGNRMADTHEPSPADTSTRNTYKHVLGRPLTEGSSAGLQWGDEYRNFHHGAFSLMWQWLCPGGYLILNTKDHVRDFKVQPMTHWTRTTMRSIGFELVHSEQVFAKGNGQGQNGKSRIPYEWVTTYRIPPGM